MCGMGRRWGHLSGTGVGCDAGGPTVLADVAGEKSSNVRRETAKGR